MNYSVVKISGKQHLVAIGSLIAVDNLPGKVKDKVKFDEVLLQIDDKNNVIIGRPTIKGASVTAEIVKQFKDKKVKVVQFKSKSRYRKTKGHRQSKTQLKIVKI